MTIYVAASGWFFKLKPLIETNCLNGYNTRAVEFSQDWQAKLSVQQIANLPGTQPSAVCCVISVSSFDGSL